MKFIKLSAITTKAQNVINEYGDIWKYVAQVDKPDTYFFQSRRPQIYIVPSPKPTRNPREDFGKDYYPPTQPANLGGRWIQAENDPEFEFEEFKLGRK